MPYEPNQEYETHNRKQAERALRIANDWGKNPKWTITEFNRGIVPCYCLTRSDGSTDDRATLGEIMGVIVGKLYA